MNYILSGLLSIFLFTSFPLIAIAEPNNVITHIIEKPITDPLFEKIGSCESNNKLDAKNPNSSAAGEYQITNDTWIYYGKKLWGDDWVNKDKKSLDNRELAWYIYTHYGTKDWEADPKSYECWKVEEHNGVYKNIY